MKKKYRVKIEGCSLLTDCRNRKRCKHNRYIWNVLRDTKIMRVETCEPVFYGLEKALKFRHDWVDTRWELVVTFFVPVNKTDVVRHVIDTFNSFNGRCILYIREDNLIKY